MSVEALARQLAVTDPARVEEFLAGCGPEDQAAVEAALALLETERDLERGKRDAAEAAMWRQDPARMANYLTRGRIRLWRYVQLLGEKYRQLVSGESTRQIWNLPARYGKPVAVDALVLMGDGSRKRLGDVQVGDKVITHAGRARRVLAVHEQGMLPAVRVVTGHGRSTVAALDHPFLTAGGWVEAAKLRPGDNQGATWGDVLATVARPDTTSWSGRRVEEYRLAGYFVGDGSVTAGGRQESALACNVTCADPVEAADLDECAAAMGWRVSVQKRPDPRHKASRYSFRIGTTGRAGGPRQWLRDADLAGHTSWSKRVPAWVFSSPPAMVAEFVGAYFACDGTVAGGPGGRAIEFYSVSRDLLADVQHLLLRLGIPSSLSGKQGLYAGQVHHSWRLRVLGRDGAARFAERVPVRSRKAAALAALDARRQAFDASLLPDPVVAVEHVGEVECRCLTVAEDATFTADDLVVHNSLFGSQWGPAWQLDDDPRSKLILVSYGDTLALENAIAVRSILREHAGVLRAQLQPDRQQAGRFTTTEGGGLLAAGILSTITGFGGDGVVFDDPFKNWQEAHSEARRELIDNTYKSVVTLRLESERAFILVIQTRWHEDDQSGRLWKRMQDGTGEAWDVVRIPALAEPHDPSSHDPLLRIPDPLGRAPGEPIEPERFPVGTVRQRALSLGSYLAAALEQQRPAPEEGGEIKRAWFRLDDNLPGDADEWITSWDMKLKSKEAGDFVVGQTWARTGSSFWLTAQLRGQWNQPTTENAIALAAVREQRCRLHVLENTGNGPEVADALRTPNPDYRVSDEVAGLLGMTAGERLQVEAVRHRGLSGVHLEKVQGDKSARMRVHSGALEAGDVHVWGSAPWLGTYLDEMAAFPNGAHDDQVDATSQALKYLRRVGGPATINAPSGLVPRSPIVAPRGLTVPIRSNGRLAGPSRLH